MVPERMLDVKTGRYVENPAILITDGTITEIGTQGALTAPANAEVIDLPGHTLLPGFIDMHTHLTGKATLHGYRRLGVSSGDKAVTAIVNGEKTLAGGFTPVRNLGSGGYEITSVRDAINRGEIDGPRIFEATVSLGGTGGHCSDNNLLPPEAEAVGEGVADGPWALRAKVRQNIKYGADLIKICSTGGVLSKGTIPGVQQMTEEEIRAVVEEAHMRGLKVASHSHGTEGIKAAIRGGVHSIEHGTYVDDEAIELFKKHGCYLVPTIHAGKFVAEKAEEPGYFNPAIREKAAAVGPQIQSSVAKAYEAGVKIAFGTDVGVGAHGTNTLEFVYMHEAGVTPMDCLVSATINAADLCGIGDRLGVIREGMSADIIAVGSNPLEDVAAMQDVRFVMARGSVYKREVE